MHPVTKVTYTGDGGAQQFALVLAGDQEAEGNLDLLVWQKIDGWSEKQNVPHGSAEQGDTWH